MPIQYINVGNIANDGTGDDLREAFIKINDNFEELDLRQADDVPIENVGSVGEPIYAGVTDGIHGFKRLISGTNINITSNDTSVTIESSDFLDRMIYATDNGDLTVLPSNNTVRLAGDTGLETSVDGNTLKLSLTGEQVVFSDKSPELGGDLNLNNKNLISGNSITANTFRGNLEGTVYGYDVRQIAKYTNGFDFGGIVPSYTNAVEFILSTIDLDFGTVDNPSTAQVEFPVIS